MESVENYVSSVIKHYGKIDGLVNNAGGQFVIYAEALSSKGYNLYE
jgi:NAD(P)-dependent dehydrogenase (short-subunit alcohol dehydrogenase family)